VRFVIFEQEIVGLVAEQPLPSILDDQLGRRFRLILIPYRAFNHLLTPEDQRRISEETAKQVS